MFTLNLWDISITTTATATKKKRSTETLYTPFVKQRVKLSMMSRVELAYNRKNTPYNISELEQIRKAALRSIVRGQTRHFREKKHMF